METNITNRVYRIKHLMQKFSEKSLNREEEIELYTFALGSRERAEEMANSYGQSEAGEKLMSQENL